MDLRSMIRASCALVSAVGFGSVVAAQTLPPGVSALTPGQLKYSESPRAPGVLTAPLFGVPSKTEYYVFRAKLTVISGTLYVGHGTTMDRDNAIAYPPGSYLREPGGTVHFLFTKDEVVEVEVRGIGPRQNIYSK
jgi:hypothetical protein